MSRRGLRCPECGGALKSIIDSRPREDAWRRRRICVRCGCRATTYEVVATASPDPEAVRFYRSPREAALAEIFAKFQSELEGLFRPAPSGSTIAAGLRSQTLERDGFRCRRCGARAPHVQLHVDHIVPRVLGGLDEPSNLQTLCQDCNLGKLDRAPTAHDLDATRPN